MILYVNGDSNSAGFEVVDPDYAWPTVLAKAMGFDLINQAAPGASNDRIMRTTQEYLAQNPCPDFLILGWSTWEREEWNVNDKYIDITASGKDSVPEHLIFDYQRWVIRQKDGKIRIEKCRRWHEKIHALHKDLMQKNIAHCFFNAFSPFICEASWDKNLRLDWNDCFIEPYTTGGSYFEKLCSMGHQPTPGYHHTDAGQRAWAEFMLDWIIQSHLL